jgi:hypothetical protein
MNEKKVTDQHFSSSSGTWDMYDLAARKSQRIFPGAKIRRKPLRYNALEQSLAVAATIQQ